MRDIQITDSYQIRGLGTVLTIDPMEVLRGAINVGDRVTANGIEYEVTGIEERRVLTDPPKTISYGLQVRHCRTSGEGIA